MTHPYVTFTAIDPPGLTVTAQLFDGPVTPSVDAGWTTVSRPKQTAITEWAGNNPISVDIPIMFDGFADDTEVEADIFRLYSLMRVRVGERAEPPVVQIGGTLKVFALAKSGWVINGISPGDEIRRDSDGHRIRAIFNVTILEYVEGNILFVRRKDSPAKRLHSLLQHKGAVTRFLWYHVKQGDDIGKIAVHFLGSRHLWRVIADLNGIRDPKSIKIGQRLKIPKS